MAVYGSILQYMAVYGSIWVYIVACGYIYMATYGCIWLCISVYGCILHCMGLYSCIWPYIAVYGRIWPYTDVYGCFWLYMVVHCLYLGIYGCICLPMAVLGGVVTSQREAFWRVTVPLFCWYGRIWVHLAATCYGLTRHSGIPIVFVWFCFGVVKFGTPRRYTRAFARVFWRFWMYTRAFARVFSISRFCTLGGQQFDTFSNWFSLVFEQR